MTTDKPSDPFAPEEAPEVDLELAEPYELAPRRHSASTSLEARLADDPVEAKGPSTAPAGSSTPQAPVAKASYAERHERTRREYWLLTRTPVLLILAWFTLSHIAFGSSWVFIDGVNLVFHEAGHVLFRWGGDTIYFLGGTLGQLLWPFGLGLYFLLLRHERFSAVVCAWWFGENLVNIARYMHDAPVEELPLVGGDTHDWNHLFGKWHMMRRARDVADVFRFVGIVLMLAGLGYLLYMTLRPTDRELAAGFSADE